MISFFHASPDMFCVLNAERQIILFNSSWHSELDMSYHDLHMCKFIDLVVPRDVAYTNRMLDSLEKSEVVRFFNRFRRENNDPVTLEWKLSRASNENIYGVARKVSRECAHCKRVCHHPNADK